MRILEGTHDLLEEVKYAIEQKLNLSDYSDMVRPVVLNFTTVMRICLLVGLSDKTPRSKSKVENLQTSAGMQPLGGSFFTKSNIKEVFVALIKMRYSDIDADWQNSTFLSKVLFSEMMRGKSILMEEGGIDEWLHFSPLRGGKSLMDIPELNLYIGQYEDGMDAALDINSTAISNTQILIAGTTGSGKSVGLNCMILSLLYRLTPDQCRMIMIDPKMLELSIYDDIPHLLSPVVTEPQKAVRALKWAVEQMEDRYRMMSSLSVRNLANYNEKVRTAIGKGKPLGRRVQTGYDGETGQPIYEEEQLDYQPLPQIVVVVDELADLMMTAGKEVEFLIQRLAQKARAAGIHLIMATQRPSVDVITGVIKANLPTRISFAVTSKIDSRTILGEQGAEQLLGKGDMLYMPGGKGLSRVHGPFVSDDEVRAVADHWRAQGSPEYIQSVTEEPEDGGFALEGAPTGEDSAEDRMYRKACQIVIDSQKASTSWLQRQLRIGYNSAARLIERMEEEGVVSAPNHVGRRDVMIDQHGQPR